MSNKETAEISKKSRVTLFLLALFFGLFGVHSFYAGKPINGVVHIVLFIVAFSVAYIHINIQMFAAWMLVLWVAAIIRAIFGIYKDSEGLKIKRWSV